MRRSDNKGVRQSHRAIPHSPSSDTAPPEKTAEETSESLQVLGIMSGTSIDSVDYVVCAISDERVTLQKHWQRKFPAVLQNRLQAAASGRSSSHEIAQLHHDLGRLYAEQAQCGLANIPIHLAGLHGQTIFHHPSKKNAATFQLGEPAYLVEKLRVPVVSNFRSPDLAAGGQGAPLATLFHRVVFAGRGLHVCVNNLGGISNVTSMDWRRGDEPRMAAFDTGPANLLIDLAVQRLTNGKVRCDKNGSWAEQGTPSEKLLNRWLADAYFSKKPPKSTGRELFGETFFEPAWRAFEKIGATRFDRLATLTEFTARSIALNYRLHLPSVPDRVILAGGGARNGFLVKRIRAQLSQLNSNLDLRTSEECGWPSQSIEAAAFALLAYYRWDRRPGNIPSTTGASRPALLGQISEP